MHKRRKKQNKYQQGGFSQGTQPNILELLGNSGLFGNDFSYEDALNFGNQVLPGETLQASLFDSERPFIDGTLGNLAQGQAQNEMENFLLNPTIEGLDTYGQGLSRGVSRRARRRLEKGKALTGRQQRKLAEVAPNALPTQQSNIQTGYQDQANSLGSLFDLFGGLLNFEKGGIAKDKVSAKISTLVGEGYPQKQAVAIALDMARRKKLQMGGMAQLGFSDGSPYRTRKEINIPSNVISMKNTSIPLALIPNKGKPMIAPPRSGQYVFPGATSVREVRLFQLGGEVEGGFLPVQLEKGEMIVLPDVWN